MSKAEKITQCVEVLCNGGCNTVRSAISSLQNNNPVQSHEHLVNALDEQGRAVLLAELVSIMAVYEKRDS